MTGTPNGLEEQRARAQGTIHVLTITPFYPTLENDAAGCFIAEPVPWMEQVGIRHKVLAVRPIYYARAQPSSSAVAAVWKYYPALPSRVGLASAGAFLFATVLAQVQRMHAADPFDIIHAHAALPCGHAALLLSRNLARPFIVTVHGLDAFSDNQVKGLAGRWCRRVSQLVYRTARGVVCISERVRDQVLEGSPSLAHATVIHNGVDPARFFPAEEESPDKVILSVGNLIRIKGHQILLRALKVISTKHPNVCLDIIGEGPERQRLTALAEELGLDGKVRFRGRQSRASVVAAMRACTVFALPSRYEGLGCVYLEAMSCAKPIIACRGQGIDDVVQHPRNGWLVEPGNVQEVAAALDQLLVNTALRQQMGDRARRTILGNFTFAHQAARLNDFYRECLK